VIAIIGKDVKIFSLPLGSKHRDGYAHMVGRVCQVWHKKMNWTGFLVIKDSVLTTGFYPHGKEFDLIFPEMKETSGFLQHDWGELIELGVGAPKVPPLYSQSSHVLPNQVLFSIGSFFGIPYTLASCTVEKVLITDRVMTAERKELLDDHSPGSPVFNTGGSLVGILEAYIEKTDRMVIRALTSNTKGLLR
jgi:hypothetical protein